MAIHNSDPAKPTPENTGLNLDNSGKTGASPNEHDLSNYDLDKRMEVPNLSVDDLQAQSGYWDYEEESDETSATTPEKASTPVEPSPVVEQTQEITESKQVEIQAEKQVEKPIADSAAEIFSSLESFKAKKRDFFESIGQTPNSEREIPAVEPKSVPAFDFKKENDLEQASDAFETGLESETYSVETPEQPSTPVFEFKTPTFSGFSFDIEEESQTEDAENASFTTTSEESFTSSFTSTSSETPEIKDTSTNFEDSSTQNQEKIEDTIADKWDFTSESKTIEFPESNSSLNTQNSNFSFEDTYTASTPESEIIPPAKEFTFNTEEFEKPKTGSTPLEIADMPEIESIEEELEANLYEEEGEAEYEAELPPKNWNLIIGFIIFIIGLFATSAVVVLYVLQLDLYNFIFSEANLYGIPLGLAAFGICLIGLSLILSKSRSLVEQETV